MSSHWSRFEPLTPRVLTPTHRLESDNITLKPAQWIRVAFVLTVACRHIDEDVAEGLQRRQKATLAATGGATVLQTWSKRLGFATGEVEDLVAILRGRPSAALSRQ